MSDNDRVLYERRGAAAWLTLNEPEKRNALTPDLVSGVDAGLRRAYDDDAVRAVVLTGAGKAFCAGADLKGGTGKGSLGKNSNDAFVDMMKSIRHGAKPVIAAVNGPAFGGGLGLVCACDIAISADSVQYSFSEVRIGVIPAMISVVVLPKLGEHQTMRLFLTGERFDAARALDYGLLHRVVPAANLVAAVDEDVAAIAKGGPNAVREAKALVRTIPTLDEDAAFAYAAEKVTGLFASDEAAEGLTAFVEKRPPAWVKP